MPLFLIVSEIYGLKSRNGEKFDMFDKNVYKITVVCCNYAVASYPPRNRRRAFHGRKYRRSAGDSCIANKPPENAQWNAPLAQNNSRIHVIVIDVFLVPPFTEQSSRALVIDYL